MEQVKRPPSLTEVAARNIREEIVSGNLAPGASLNEAELGKKLDVSRSTVREALRLLQQEGLIEIVPYRGAFVTHLTPKKVEEIYTMRALLEPHAVRLSIENRAIRGDVRRQLEAVVERLTVLEKGGDFHEFVEADLRFHDLTTQGCQHDLLLDTIKNLRSLIFMFILNTKLYNYLLPDEVTHRSILNVILDGDPDVAEEIVRQHIIEAGTSLVMLMEARMPEEALAPG